MFSKANLYRLAGAASVGAVSLVSVSSAGAVAPYDVSPVTTGITDQITGELPVILPVAGGLIALGLGMRLVRKFTKA